MCYWAAFALSMIPNLTTSYELKDVSGRSFSYRSFVAIFNPEPLDQLFSRYLHSVLYIPDNEVNEGDLQATTIVRINLAARPILVPFGPLLPELTRPLGRQSDVHQSLPRDHDRRLRWTQSRMCEVSRGISLCSSSLDLLSRR